MGALLPHYPWVCVCGCPNICLVLLLAALGAQDLLFSVVGISAVLVNIFLFVSDPSRISILDQPPFVDVLSLDFFLPPCVVGRGAVLGPI